MSETQAVNPVEEVRALGVSATCVRVDMSSLDIPATVLKATINGRGCDKTDILVNNAGLGGNATLEDGTAEEYERLMAVNVRAVIFMMQTVLPAIRRGSRIINLYSISAAVVLPRRRFMRPPRQSVKE